MRHYEENNDYYDTYTDKRLKKELFKRDTEFYKSDTFKRFFL